MQLAARSTHAQFTPPPPLGTSFLGKNRRCHVPYTLTASHSILCCRPDERWGVQLREYFQNRRRLMHTGNYSIILKKLSPGLRGKVGRWMTRRWYSRVPFLPMHPSCDLYVDLALALEPALYAPSETIDAHELHILERGIVMKDSRVIPSGCVWGEVRALTRPDPTQVLP